MIVGTEEVMDYVHKFSGHCSLTEAARRNLCNYPFKKKPWSQFVTAVNKHLVCSRYGFDLLSRMLTVDHTERISSKDALDHPFFNSVRD